MAKAFPGDEWKRILDLLDWLISHPDKIETIFGELPELDKVKAIIAVTCRSESPEALKFAKAFIDKAERRLVLAALQILPRQELSRLVLQSFEGGALSELMKFVIDSLSETELVGLAFLSLLSTESLILLNFLVNILTESRRKEVFEAIARKRGLT